MVFSLPVYPVSTLFGVFSNPIAALCIPPKSRKAVQNSKKIGILVEFHRFIISTVNKIKCITNVKHWLLQAFICLFT